MIITNKKIAKKTIAKKTTAKKVYIRKVVRLSKNSHIDLLKAIDDNDNSLSDRPDLYMLGENKYHVVKDMIKLDEQEYAGGCSEMPQIAHDSQVQAYLKLAKKGLTGCGYARVTSSFQFGGWWGTDSGNDIYNDAEYMLSVDTYSMTAEACITHKEFTHNSYGSKRLITLYVEILDK